MPEPAKAIASVSQPDQNPLQPALRPMQQQRPPRISPEPGGIDQPFDPVWLLLGPRAQLFRGQQDQRNRCFGMRMKGWVHCNVRTLVPVAPP